MNDASSLPQDHLQPRPLPGRGTGVLLTLLAHGLLLLGLALGLNWHVSQPTTVQAELWSEVPRAAAPRAVEPPPTEPPPPPQPTPPVVKPPEPRPAPPTPSRAAEDAQIATEKAKREKEREEREDREQRQREEAKKKARAEAEAEKAEQKKAAEKLAAQKAATEKEEAAKRKAQEDKDKQAQRDQEQRTAAAREAQLKRIQGLAGGSGEPTSSGTAAQSSGPSLDYLGRVAAQIKPRINNPSVAGNPTVVFEIFLASDGRIVSQRLMTPSGVPAWDNAVERGIIDTKILPRMPDGTAPKSIILSVRPGD